MGRRKKRRRVDNQPKYIQACADKSVFQGEEIKDKYLILEYMKSFELYAVSPGRIFDEIEQREVSDICYSLYTDGQYIWSTRSIYHFEKYNMPLKSEFVEYVLSKAVE